MDKTPKTKLLRLSCKNYRKNEDSSQDDEVTPKANRRPALANTAQTTPSADSETEDSPYFLCTQDGSEDMDVIWDWNSPQCSQKRRRAQKRIIIPSPKVPVKKHPSHNDLEKLQKLREEFEALKRDIAVPDNEDCLLLSPVEEIRIRDESKHSALHSLIDEESNFSENEALENIFNDSADEELFQCTQKVEKILGADETEPSNSDKHTFLGVLQKTNKLPGDTYNPTKIGEPVYKFKSTTYSNSRQLLGSNNTMENQLRIPNVPDYKTTDKLDDSFDVALEAFQDDEIEKLSQVCLERNKNQQANFKQNSSSVPVSTGFQRATSELIVSSSSSNTIEKRTGRVELVRTHSFELSKIGAKEGPLPQSTLEQIERKRREALEKLQAKRKHSGDSQTNCGSVSPIKCSPTEIEQKRLQAIAKLQKRKQEQEIERKRQEALRKLEQSKMKNNFPLKSALAKRL